MLPLEKIASLLSKHGHTALALSMRSLAAREEMRIEGFWEDLGAAEIWAREDSLAAIVLEDADDQAQLRRALFQVAEEMRLRGTGTPDSDWWAEQIGG